MSSAVLSLTRPPAVAHGRRLSVSSGSSCESSASNSIVAVCSSSRISPIAPRFAHLRSSESAGRAVALAGFKKSPLHPQRRSRIHVLPGESETSTAVAEEKETGVSVRASEDQQQPINDADQSGSVKTDSPASPPPPPSSMKSLDAYFDKLNGKSSSSSRSTSDGEQQPSSVVAATASTEVASTESTSSPAASASSSPSSTSASAASAASGSAEKKKATKDFQALSSLNSYFDKLNAGKPKKKDTDSDTAPAASQSSAATSTTPAPTSTSSPAQADVGSKSAEAGKAEKAGEGGKDDIEARIEESLNGKRELKAEDVEELIRRIVEDVEKKKASGAVDSKTGTDLTLDAIMGPPNLLDEWISARAASSAPTAIYAIVAVNIAVFLFELASPEAVPGVITTSLPGLLGAKVNVLIDAGEWWRLLTPSLLHAGIIHLSVGTFFLLGIGSVLEFAIGPLGLLAVYLSSGLAGNIVSFLQTPEVTVGGTGPVYGIAAAYAAFLIKNREVIGTETADSNVRESLIIASLFALFASPLPIDPCTHIGAALAGFLFGSIAAPSMRKVQISNEEAAKRQQGLLTSLLNKQTDGPAYELVVEAADSKRLAAAFGASMALSLVLFQLSQGFLPDMDLLQSFPSQDVEDVWL